MTNKLTWKKAQEWESHWWATCHNTLGEELKQIIYATRMGLTFFHNKKSPYNIDMKGASILDIGGGPVSLLLKCVNVQGTVYDPMPVPEWVELRYKIANIKYGQYAGENIPTDQMFDEVWMYNVLQHTQDPQLIIQNAQKVGKLIRIFEWLETETNIGHPHTFTREGLDSWLNGRGKVEKLNGEGNCYGWCYYGIFLT